MSFVRLMRRTRSIDDGTTKRVVYWLLAVATFVLVTHFWQRETWGSSIAAGVVIGSLALLANKLERPKPQRRRELIYWLLGAVAIVIVAHFWKGETWVRSGAIGLSIALLLLVSFSIFRWVIKAALIVADSSKSRGRRPPRL
jgi:peptidoglycan/LPS O-acetylase OafA/YrhL